MKETFIYLLETLACSGVLLAAYSILLERRAAFVVCRVYLLFAVVAAAIIPALDIPVLEGEVLYATPVVAVADADNITVDVIEAQPQPFDAAPLCFAIYALGTVLSLAVMAAQMIRMRRLARNAERIRFDLFDLVKTPQEVASFSFFRTIYVNRDVAADDLRTIIAHEASHIAHRHSVERVAMELLKAFMWWNPFVWIAARRLVEVQEYEADRDVLEGGYDVSNYISTLLKHLFGYSPEIANGLRDSLTKKRLKMMTTKTGGRYALLRTAAVIPVVAGLLAAFSLTAEATEIRYIEPLSETVSEDTPDSAPVIAAAVTAAAIAADDKAPKKSADEPTERSAAEAETATDVSDELKGTVVSVRKGGNDVRHNEIGSAVAITRMADAPAAPPTGQAVTLTVKKFNGTLAELAADDIKSIDIEDSTAVITLKNSSKVLKGRITVGSGELRKKLSDENSRQAGAEDALKILAAQYPDRLEIKNGGSITGVGHSTATTTVSTVPNAVADGAAEPKTIVIKGSEAAFADNKPLVIIDGKALAEDKKLNDINPDEIASITVYKDKSAEKYGIYGDTSNGVILIATKAAAGQQPMTISFAGNGTNGEDAAPEYDRMPKFQGGGIAEFRRWVGLRVRYPEAARKAGIVGNVAASFFIDTDGSVCDVKILNSPDAALANEVRRVIAMSPKWTAGRQNGKAVKIGYSLPVSFAIATQAGIKRDSELPTGSADAISVTAYGD